jgi:hypothetical protein
MARIRTIKPELFTSRTVSTYSDALFRTFTGLFCYLDDMGRGEDDADLIKAEIAPRIKAKTPKLIDGHLAQLSASEDAPLCRYQVNGVSYLHLINFVQGAKHQRINRPTKSKLPPCPVHEPDGLW